MKTTVTTLSIFILFAFTACGLQEGESPDDFVDNECFVDCGQADAGVPADEADAGAPTDEADSGTEEPDLETDADIDDPDAGTLTDEPDCGSDEPDAEVEPDAGSDPDLDTGTEPDAGSDPDTGTEPDAGDDAPDTPATIDCQLKGTTVTLTVTGPIFNSLFAEPATPRSLQLNSNFYGDWNTCYTENLAGHSLPWTGSEDTYVFVLYYDVVYAGLNLYVLNDFSCVSDSKHWFNLNPTHADFNLTVTGDCKIDSGLIKLK